MLALADGSDKVLGSIDLSLCIKQGLLHLTTHVFLVGLILAECIDKRLRYRELRNIAMIKHEGHSTIIVCLDDKVGRNLLHGASHRLTHGRSWLGIQFA